MEPLDKPLVIYEEFVLETIKGVIEKRCSRQFLDQLSFKARIAHIADDISFQLKYKIMGKEDVKAHSYESKLVAEVPLTWFDHLRERFFPKWALHRWPVSYRKIYATVEYRRFRLCPHLNIAPQREHVNFLIGKDPGYPGEKRWAIQR